MATTEVDVICNVCIHHNRQHETVKIQKLRKWTLLGGLFFGDRVVEDFPVHGLHSLLISASKNYLSGFFGEWGGGFETSFP
ncbi:protein of unknown function [Denitratisoma oestradiolicum]|uniref:Uncharacterized protein n=1 Tax=Denitratisoma oestradiolicum TaxID=311182 RepID=A0A6S6XR12_9PROT|nr:protein of unknown function [Denitratisoma oestradiolicum]